MHNVSTQSYPIVSILIPAYNVANYLPQCLESVVNQTYPYLQVVVVDDGSIDNTLEIAGQYVDKYPFVEVYHQDNAGVSAARNTLISLAKGEYVLFVDSDDWIERNMVELMLNALDNSKSDIAVCGNFKEFEGSTTVCPIVNKGYVLEGSENVMKALLMHKELNGSLWNKMVPRKFYDGLTFRTDIWYGEDCLFLWQALNRDVNKICFMTDCFYHYRMNNQSISHESYNYKKQSGHDVWRIIYEDTKVKWVQLAETALASYAISDMWQLFNAAQSNYTFDQNLSIYQKNVRDNLSLIRKSGLVNYRKLLFALIMAYNYSIGSFVLRKIIKK